MAVNCKCCHFDPGCEFISRALSVWPIMLCLASAVNIPLNSDHRHTSVYVPKAL